MKKIDIHLHTTINEEGFGTKISAAPKLLDYLKIKNIFRGIIMSSGESGALNNDECMRICEKYAELYWNCNFDEVNPETIYDRMDVCKKAGAVGVGELTVNKWIDSHILQAIFAAAEKLELPVTIHMSSEEGYEYGIADYPGLPLLEKVLKDFPHLKIVGHSQVFWIEISKAAPKDREGRYRRGEGAVEPGGRLVTLFENYSNLYGDLSACSGYSAITRDEEFGLTFLEKFSDRLLFGTDTASAASGWLAPLGDWLDEKFQEGKISSQTMAKICYKNAARLYGIPIEKWKGEQ